MNLTIIVTVFALIFLAELPDKTVLASLVLGTRYRPLHVFAEATAAFAVHVALAITVGSLLTLLPRRLLDTVVGVLFLARAALMLSGRRDEQEQVQIAEGSATTFARVARTGFAVMQCASV